MRGGLLTRPRASSHDRRHVAVSLTPAGADLLEQIVRSCRCALRGLDLTHAGSAIPSPAQIDPTAG